MKEDRETSFCYIYGDAFASIFSSERKWINRILKLKEQFPKEVTIRTINADGSIYAYLPISWLKISPKRKNNMTAEQKAESKARLEIGRPKRLATMRNGDDAHTTETKDVS